MPAGPEKEFNPINGAEMAELILKDLRQRMSRDPRFRPHLVYPQFAYAFNLGIAYYPSDNGPFETAIVGLIGQAPAGQAKLTAPVPPIPPIGTFDLDTANGQVAFVPEPADVTTAEENAPATASGAVSSIGAPMRARAEAIDPELMAKLHEAQIADPSADVVHAAMQGATATVVTNPESARRGLTAEGF